MSVAPPPGWRVVGQATQLPTGWTVVQPTPPPDEAARFRREFLPTMKRVFVEERPGAPSAFARIGMESLGPLGPATIAGGVGERVLGQATGEVARRVGTRIAPIVSTVRKAVQRKPATIPVPRVATFTPQEVAQEASRMGSTDTVAAHQRLIAQSQVPRAVQFAPKTLPLEAPSGMRLQPISLAPGVEGEMVFPPRIGPTPAGVVASPESLVRPVISQAPQAKIVGAAEELFTRAGIQRDPRVLISDQVTDLMLSGRLRVEEIADTLRLRGLSWQDFSTGIFRPSVKNAAQTLGQLGRLSQRVGKFLGKNEADELAEIGTQIDEVLAARSLFKRVTVDLWRRLLVSQPATAARNFVTQVGRVGLDTIQQGMDQGLQVGINGLRRAVGRPQIPITARPLGGWETLLKVFKNPRVTAREVESLLAQFPKDYDRLFGTYLSDISTKIQRSGMAGTAEKIVVGAEKGAELLNTLNRGQEFLVRRGVFQAALETRLVQKGTSIARVVAENAIGAIDPADIAFAVDKSLELSFARSPQYGTIGAEFIRAVNRFAPITTQAIPFPRFLVNALQFYYDFSPVGFVRLLNPTQLRAIAGGNTQVLSRAIIGTGLLGAAYQLRKSGYAGERWYELRVGGRTLDTRAYNPMAPYLFVADIVKRYQDGTLYELDAKDIIAATLGANVRAGTGLYLADKLVQTLTRSGDPEKFMQMAKTLGGEFVSGFLTPLRALGDVLGQLEQWVKGTEEISTVREERAEPFTGPIKSVIPGLAQTLPEAESPTQAGPLVRQAPLLRQVTGISLLREKNPFQVELDRLQFAYRDILPSRGDPEADRLIAKHMGPLVERLGVPVVSGTAYRGLSNDQKRLVMRRLLAAIRQQAIQLATRENPRLFAELRLRSMPKDERRLLGR